MEIKFKRDTSFRKQFFVPESFSHPAKMDAQLLIWIVERYTQPGETILDPMAGSGTMMLACTLGRSVMLVELEEKFCKMMRANWEQVKMRPQLGSEMGLCDMKQGDARDLEGLFAGLIPLDKRLPQQVDKIVTSPPYAESIHPTGESIEKVIANSDPKHLGKYSQPMLVDGYSSENKDNIGNLPYGQIDKIVTSPPYEAGTSGPSRSPFWERLANDPTSARYGREKHPSVGQGYDTVDSIITSPPYESGGHHADQTGAWGGQAQALTKEQANYGKTEGNIGNLKSTSYLDAMLLVYKSCHSVLRDSGLMILVTKNFIRNKQVIRLDTDTIKLCEQAGFTYLERHYRKLPSQSFWRIIYHQKFPDVEQILNEDVLVFVK